MPSMPRVVSIARSICVSIVSPTLNRRTVNVSNSPNSGARTGALGRILFQSYLLPFEILSILLLVAMVGVILLSKKESR